MSILPLLPSEANNSVIPVLEPYSMSFFDTYFEVFWNQNSLGDLIQPQLLRVHAYCCASSEDSQPKLRYYLEYFTKDRHNRYRLVAQGHARISEIFYLEWQDRYVFYSGNNIVCPDYVSPWDTRISQLEFENTIDRWVSLSDLVIGTKQSFLPFQVDFSGCDALPENCKNGPGWYSQIIFNGDPLGDPVFLTIPTCVPFEGTEAAESIFGEFVDFIVDSIIDLAPSLINASKTFNPFIGTIVSILFDALQDAVDIDMQFCPCPSGTECVPGCGCLPPCPAGFVREGCECVADEDPPPDDLPPPSPSQPGVRTVVSPRKVPDGPNNWYINFPEFPMNNTPETCQCVRYLVDYSMYWHVYTCRTYFDGNAGGNVTVLDKLRKQVNEVNWLVVGEFLEVDYFGEGFPQYDGYFRFGFYITILARGAHINDRTCGALIWRQFSYVHDLNNNVVGNTPDSCVIPENERQVTNFTVRREDGQSMELCGWPKFPPQPLGPPSCPDGNWYLVIELVNNRNPLIKFRRIVTIPGNKCVRPELSAVDGIYYLKNGPNDAADKPLNFSLLTLRFYTPRLIDAYFFQ